MKKIFFIPSFLVCILSNAQPTFFGLAVIPSDNGSNATDPTVAIAEPASMLAGDLCFVYASKRTASGAISVNATGGQTWTAFTTTASANATLSANVFWCRFNGTWSAHPSFTYNATTNNSFIMLVFRPVTQSNSWAVDAAQTGIFVDRAAAASFTITGWTPGHANNVNIGAWNTDDDNTWGTLTGDNWTKGTLSNQYRNIAGNDVSASFAYQLQGSAAATNNVSQTEATNGNDGGFTFAISFYEYTPAAHDNKQDFFKLFGAKTKQPDYIYGTSFKFFAR